MPALAETINPVTEFLLEMGNFTRARQQFEAASQRRLECRIQLANVRAEKARIETDIVANGGHDVGGEFLIDGINAEKRKAQTERALLNFPAWGESRQAEIDAQAEHDDAEAEMTYAEHAMRGSRISIEFLTSWNYRAAAAEGGPAEGKGNHNGN